MADIGGQKGNHNGERMRIGSRFFTCSYFLVLCGPFLSSRHYGTRGVNDVNFLNVSVIVVLGFKPLMSDAEFDTNV